MKLFERPFFVPIFILCVGNDDVKSRIYQFLHIQTSSILSELACRCGDEEEKGGSPQPHSQHTMVMHGKRRKMGLELARPLPSCKHVLDAGAACNWIFSWHRGLQVSIWWLQGLPVEPAGTHGYRGADSEPPRRGARYTVISLSRNFAKLGRLLANSS